MGRENQIVSERLRKLKELKEQGINPYPANSNKKQSCAECLKLKISTKIKIAGRIMSIRNLGKIAFAKLKDNSGEIQIVFQEKKISEKQMKFFKKYLDAGDFVEIAGEIFKTKTNQISILVKGIKLLSKSILPLPEKWHGLQNDEDKFRKRYLDILMNDEVKNMFIKKGIFWNSVRNFLIKKGFIEVETPALEITPGGADAKPFVSHHNALDMDVYLRISMGELWQKKLMIAGFEKTFEIGRQFRNEGMDMEHLQDYTQMEFYWAYADYKKGMKLTEELYKHIAKETFGTLKFKIKNFNINLGKKWEIYDYQETVKKQTGIEILNTTKKDVEKKLNELKIEYDKKGFNINRGIDCLWKYCRKKIAGPGFLIGVPVCISPLAKRDEERKEISQRFQPIIAGSELGNGYSELNDPIDQEQRFDEQQKLKDAGDEEAQTKDDEFIEALKYGMPPVCGFGMSERVFSFLMDKPMRECQIFPLMKPWEKEQGKKK